LRLQGRWVPPSPSLLKNKAFSVILSISNYSNGTEHRRCGYCCFLSPVDVIPDFLVGLGWLDDLILIGLLIWFLSGRSIPLFARFGSPPGGTRRAHERSSQRASGSSRTQQYDDRSLNDPYSVLGIKRGASVEEIREAYRIAAAKYHPDKVSHLGKEFQELAHQRFVAIQQAYERLMKSHRP